MRKDKKKGEWEWEVNWVKFKRKRRRKKIISHIFLSENTIKCQYFITNNFFLLKAPVSYSSYFLYNLN